MWKPRTKRSKRDLIVGKPGVIPEAPHLKDSVAAFDYYFPQDLQKKICSFTNKRIASTLSANVNTERSVQEYIDTISASTN